MPRLPWISAIGAALAALGLCAALIGAAERSPTPPEEPVETTLSGDPDPNEVTLAGSGSNLPLTRVLARHFRQSRPDIRVRVHPSIGSAGGIAAVKDGAVDIGLVSRAPTPEEAEGLELILYARVAVAVAAHPTGADASLTPDALFSIFDGSKTTWGSGEPIRLLLREPGDSAHHAFGERLTGFTELHEEAWRSQRFPVLLTDQAMAQALLS
ncbi:MAG: substrate-binding domain-containing protein, partial [Myxococcota bacterium]